MDSLIGKVLSSRYEVIEKIGDGGMGLVYKGKDRLLNRFVAIKTLKNEFAVNEEFLLKFKKEAQASAGLSHPNIVNIYDVGMDEQTNYIVMEFVDGITLKEFISQRGPAIRETEIIQIAKQIADALSHAHKNHIIHRDIKSQNIMITDNLNAKVGDFGIARALTTATLTATKEVMGSVHYSSPEQARGSHVDERSDIYSLGVIMYEMVTGRLPFNGETPVAVALKHVKEDIIPPSNYRSSLSIGLESMIYKCMMKNQVERFQTAAELSRDLDTMIKNPNAMFDYFDTDTKEFATMVMPDSDELRKAERDRIGRDESAVYDNYSADDFEDMEEFSENERKPQKKKSVEKPMPKKKSGGLSGRKDIWVPAIAGIAVAALIFAVLYGFLTGRLGGAGGQIVVPDVTNMTYNEAAAKLQAAKLNVAIKERQPNATVPKDSIIAQDPAGQTRVNENTVINLIVSDGNAVTSIPDVVGKTLDEARTMITSAGFSVGDVRTGANKLPLGQIYEQTPTALTQAAPGTVVNLMVSEGDGNKVTMPTITGKNLTAAENALKAINLNLGSISYDNSTKVAKDLIITQSVAPGTKVAEGTTVDVVVSKGVTGVTKNYTIPLDRASSDTFVVKVVKATASSESVVYQKTHSRDDGELDISVTSSGTTRIKIYFDNELVENITDQF